MIPVPTARGASRRTISYLVLGLSAWVITSPPAPAAESQPGRAPNLVVVLIDNLGRDWFGCYGSDEAQTPNIDKLAATGVRFAHCYVTAMCSTTRAAFLTGRYGFRTGWHTHHDAAIYGGGNFDWDREVTFARPLKAAGYATVITGKWQINDLYEQRDALRRHGFDEHLVWTGALVGGGTAAERFEASQRNNVRELESRYWDPVIFRNGERRVVTGHFGPDLYLEYLIEFMERNRAGPFLAYLATPLVHVPVVATPHSKGKALSDREQHGAMVHYMDHQIGQLVAALERLKLRDDTIVIVTTDNGSNSKLGGRMGGKLIPGGLGKMTEPGLDVPLIVNCPARVPGGRVSDRLVDCTDFFPTLLELAGAKPPPGVVIDGHSFADTILNRPAQHPPREWMLGQYASERAVRDARFKLYRSGGFFDVTADLLEKNNLAQSGDAEIVAARRRLQAVLDGLPPDANLPFSPRSSSAFRLQGKK